MIFFSMVRVSLGIREGGNPASVMNPSPVIERSKIMLPGISTFMRKANLSELAVMASDI